jgi:hypothetical protein
MRFYAPLDLSGKKGALIGLGATCVVIYGPKVVEVMARKARSRTPQPHPTRATVEPNLSERPDAPLQ